MTDERIEKYRAQLIELCEELEASLEHFHEIHIP